MAEQRTRVNMTEYKILRVVCTLSLVICGFVMVLPVSSTVRGGLFVILGIGYLRLLQLRFRIIKDRKTTFEATIAEVLRD